MNDIIFSSVCNIARLIKDREVSAVEVTKLHLDRIDKVNPTLNAVITRCDDIALEQAAIADKYLAEGRRAGPLHGVPVTIKDAFDTAGVRSTSGTKGRADYIPAKNATVVQRILSAGAILIGKTNIPDLTLFYDTDNLLFGRTNNPYDLNCSPGGSSGGAAAIVAAGGSSFELGSDTGGSIRLPAHFCGVAGIKPTTGRVPKTGLIPPCGTPVDAMSHVGPITRFVDDLALLLPIIAGVDWQDSSVVPMPFKEYKEIKLENLKMAYYTDNRIVPASPEVAGVVRDCALLLADRQAKVSESCPTGIEKTRDIFRRIFGIDGGAWVRRIIEMVGSTEIYPFLKWTDKRDDVPEASAGDFTFLLHEWELFRRDMLGFMQNYDVIISPVHVYTAMPHKELLSPENSPAFSYAQTSNLTGWPAVVVRAGTSTQGLPIGVEVVAQPWREDVAIAVAKCIEDAFGGWKPPPAFSS